MLFYVIKPRRHYRQVMFMIIVKDYLVLFRAHVVWFVIRRCM